MPTTFNVFSLGVWPFIDPTEGNQTAENAGALVGQTFGSPGNALLNSAATLTPVSFSGGTVDAYDMNNALSSDTFRINGGPVQTFDGVAVYNATITYINGSTATITAVIFQDTVGNTYWAPELTANPDQTAMEALPIRSLTLNSVNGATFTGLGANRQVWNFLLCFSGGTRIRTPRGEVEVEALSPGDLVETADNGPQPILWIGASKVRGSDTFAPVRIAPGALGEGVPARPLLVSRQHRLLLRSRIGARQLGADEFLAPAIGLVGHPGIELAEGIAEITYHHILLDRHEIVFAEGAPAETLYPGPMARQAIGPKAEAEIEALFPGLLDRAAEPARPIVAGRPLRNLVARHVRHGRPLLAAA
jgi:hypothetical protein